MIVDCFLTGAIPLFTRHPALRAAPALPGGPHHGERTLHEQWEDEHTCQVAEEHLQVWRGHGMHTYQLAGGGRSRQVRRVRW